MKGQRRHELKEDAFVAFISSLWGVAKSRLGLVVFVLAGLLAGVIVLVAVSMYSSHAARKAGAVYAQAISVDDSAGLDDDALRDLRISRLSAAGPQLAGTVVEPEYLKELADLLFEKGGNDSLVKAVALYDKLLQKYPDARFAVYAQLSRAKALFALGEYARAAEGFAAVYADSKVDSDQGGGPAMGLGPQAKWMQGQCFLARGDVENARKAFSTCITEGPDTSWAQDAQMDLRDIRAEVPFEALPGDEKKAPENDEPLTEE